MSTPIFASIPDSVVIGNNAYDIRYLFNKSNYDEINSSLTNNPYEVYYRLKSQTGGKIFNIFNNVALTDDEVNALPPIIFKALDGKQTLYEAGDGEAVQSSPDNWFTFSDSTKTTITGLTPEGHGRSIIVIPSSVTSIGQSAFENCSLLKSIIIPDSVTSIGEWAFYSCSELTSITIPKSVTNICDFAFGNCTSLTSIKVDSNNLQYCDIDGVLYDKNKTIIIKYPARKTDNYYIIPDSVTSIGTDAFGNCTGLTSITIPNSVSRIGQWPFYLCTGLKSIKVDSNNLCYCDIDGVLYNKDKTSINKYPARKIGASYAIPDSVTNIGQDAFGDSIRLASITVPNKVTSIGEYAFGNCAGLTSMTIPSSVTSIGQAAFDGCEIITTIIIPDKVTNIEQATFIGCEELSTITIPDSVVSIGKWAFNGCPAMTVKCSQTEWDKFKDVFPNGSTRVDI